MQTIEHLTLEQQATNFDTMRHIENVRNYLNMIVKELLERGEKHDQSKLESPEVELFTKYTDQLATSTYDSSEYHEFRKKLGPALEHHYANNRHHPEFHANGIKDMDLVDLIEMLIDWYCASKRHNNGNIRKSIDANKERFSMSDELVTIFKNTLKYIE